MTGAIGGVGAIGGMGAIGGVGSVGGVSAGPAPSAGVDAGAQPSTIVSLGGNNSQTLFGTSAANGVSAYSTVQALDGNTININHISQQTGLSTDFVNGFVMGVGMAEQAWNDKLTDALILMLLMDKMNKQ